MPRTARASAGGVIYHVLNRGNGRARVFHKDGDYAAFVELIGVACRRIPMRLLGFCLMPNHVHLEPWPYRDGDLSRWMQWLMTAHVRRHHAHHGTGGHVWQGRFKSFPAQADEHVLSLTRYVERNPLRAGLVRRAQDWPHSSLRWRGAGGGAARGRPEWLVDGPVPLPAGWVRLVNEPQTPAEEEAVRHSIRRGTPLGDARWQQRIAQRLGLEASLNPIGRPRKQAKK